MASTYRTSLAFARLSDPALESFTEMILFKMGGNGNFPTPLIPLPELITAGENFSLALAEATNGGKFATATKNAARLVLLGLLRQQAAYVQSIAGEDLAKLLSSGFDVVSTNRTRIQLPAPVVEKIENPTSGKFSVRLGPVPTAHAYEIQTRYGTNGWETVGVFTDTRNIILPGLISGTLYTLQSRAVGGSTGYSGWSDPVSHMAT